MIEVNRTVLKHDPWCIVYTPREVDHLDQMQEQLYAQMLGLDEAVAAPKRSKKIGWA